MAFTSHGHHIPGTIETVFKPKEVARCGGVKMCPRCISEVGSSMAAHRSEEKAFFVGEAKDYQSRPKALVRDYVTRMFHQNRPDMDVPEFEVYVIWWSKTLQNWKVVLGTTLPDNMIFELTYDGDKRATYFDAYKKSDNFAIPD